jgi:hypothetical protein
MKTTFKTIILFLLFTLMISSSINKKHDYYYHVLMLEFSKNADIDQITKKMIQFEDIPSVKEARVGKINANDRNKINNFTHCLILKFEDKKGLQDYIKHPYHQKFLKNHFAEIISIYTADFNSISMIE